jgi:hypothetical protein
VIICRSEYEAALIKMGFVKKGKEGGEKTRWPPCLKLSIARHIHILLYEDAPRHIGVVTKSGPVPRIIIRVGQNRVYTPYIL